MVVTALPSFSRSAYPSPSTRCSRMRVRGRQRPQVRVSLGEKSYTTIACGAGVRCR